LPVNQAREWVELIYDAIKTYVILTIQVI